MKRFIPSPLLCLVVFAAGSLLSVAVGWWFVAGLCTGWLTLLTYAVATSCGDRDGGAP